MRLTAFFLTLCAAVCLQYRLSAQQQERADAREIPVVVADFYNKLVPDLQKADFAVRLAGKPVLVSSAAIDEGPKRIILILDASNNVPNDEWKLQIESAEILIQHARPTDLFALFVVGMDSAEKSFQTPKEISLRLRDLKRSQEPEKTYDAVLGALNSLNGTQFGDTIFLIGHDEDSGSTATLSEIRKLMLEKTVRFYGLSFADKLAKLPPGVDLNKPLPPGFGPSKLDSLSAETGYFFSFHAVRNLKISGQMTLFEGFLADLDAWIARPYRLRFGNRDGNGLVPLEIDVAQMEARRIRKGGIHYPHSLLCAVSGGVR